MALDILLREAQGLPDDVIMGLVLLIQSIKSARPVGQMQTEDTTVLRRELADKYAGKIKMAEDFDAPMEEFQEYM